jgi:UDP-N-acetylmuramoyl-L-alanyl-D-glutamate--2,6-diaminopimelate ligase
MIGYLTQNHPLIQAFAPRTASVRTRRDTLVRNRVFKMAPKLSDYFGEGEMVAVKGSLDRPISGLVLDSRRRTSYIFLIFVNRKLWENQ